jgi:hypothetical protein
MIFVVAGATDTDLPTVLYDSLLARSVLSGPVGAGMAYANILGPQTYDYWGPGAATGILTATLGAAETCNAIGVAAHNLGTTGAVVTFQSSPDLVSGFTNIRTVTAADDDPFLVLFPDRLGQRWRINITASASGLPVIGIAMFGQKLALPGAVQPPYVPLNKAARIDLMNNVSLGGHYLGAAAYRGARQSDVEVAPLPRLFVDGAFTPFARHFDKGGTFFFAGAPAYMPDDVGYCWRADGASEARPAYVPGGNYAQLKLGMAGYGA